MERALVMGTWRVTSQEEPRWNQVGRAMGSILDEPSVMHDWVKECTEKYGQPPADLTVGFSKN